VVGHDAEGTTRVLDRTPPGNSWWRARSSCAGFSMVASIEGNS
jgi:hypothetical protein